MDFAPKEALGFLAFLLPFCLFCCALVFFFILHIILRKNHTYARPSSNSHRNTVFQIATTMKRVSPGTKTTPPKDIQPETTVQLSKKQKKQLADAQRKEDDLKRITDANISDIIYLDDFRSFTSPPERKPFLELDLHSDDKHGLSVDSYVEVASDFSPYSNRPFGCGFITDLRRSPDDSSKMVADVKYTKGHDGGRKHKAIPVEDLTIASLHQDFVMAAPKRSRVSNMMQEEVEIDLLPGLNKMELLVRLLEKNRRRKKGWHRHDLCLNPKLDNGGKVTRLNSEEKCQLLAEVELIRGYHAMNGGSTHKKKYATNKKFAKLKKRNTATVVWLVKNAWGIGGGTGYICKLNKQIQKNARNNGVDPETTAVMMVSMLSEEEVDITTVIDNEELAKKRFTAEYLYAINKLRKQASMNLEGIDRATYQARMKAARNEYKSFNLEQTQTWEAYRREHIRKQPIIKEALLQALRNNNSISYTKLEAKIDHWCSAGTIRRWVQSREGFNLYTERVIPLLSAEQKQKHLSFATRFRSNWGLGGGKFLLVHYDEKWFWGLVLRKTAKCFDELDAATIKAYHKSHISKVMAIAVVAFAFIDNIENGGDAIKLAFTRCQSHKVAKKTVRESRRDPNTQRLKYDGKILRTKGDLYKVDCCVTGSNNGTVDSPKFSLMAYFGHTVFNALKDLVKPGGRYDGYTVVIQGDNAGPHNDATYLKFVKEYCTREGWHWEPQGPQMPHMNVLDLSVFPNMSRRHTQLARDNYGTHVLKEDEIFYVAQQVYDNLPSSKIASGFIQAHRLARRIIEHGGDNCFLLGGSGGISTGVAKDFDETLNGLTRKDAQTFPSS